MKSDFMIFFFISFQKSHEDTKMKCQVFSQYLCLESTFIYAPNVKKHSQKKSQWLCLQ